MITVFFGIALALAYRNDKKLRLIISVSTSGYAIPGSVISAGLLVSIGYFFGVSITSFGIVGLVLCLSLRFMTPAYNYLSASLVNIKDSSEKALSTYSKDSMRAFKYFYLPHMKSATYLGLMIVFIESVKEQPATLLLRPVGFDTLSTKIYNFTSEGQWIMASNPSLMLVFLSLIFVYMINKNINENKS
jgi:iron(III) transport system permease protein